MVHATEVLILGVERTQIHAKTLTGNRVGYASRAYLKELLRCRLRRLPGGELHKGKVFAGYYPDRAELTEAVEGIAEVLTVQLSRARYTIVSTNRPAKKGTIVV